MKLTLLGTGNPVPLTRRASSGYLVRVNDESIVIDHGPGAHWRLLESGARAIDVTHVVFSHLHYDHCADFVRLFLNRWDQGAGRVRPLGIYGPTGLKHFIERLFGADGAFRLDLTARTNHPESLEIYRERGGTGARAWPDMDAHELRESDVIEGNGWRMSFVNIPHHQPYLTSFGVRIEAAGKVLTYSSDVTHPFALNERGDPVYKAFDDPTVAGHYKSLRALMTGSDLHIQYLHLPNAPAMVGEPKLLPRRTEGNVADSMHKLVADLAQRTGVKTMVLSHINHILDRPEIRDLVLADMRAIYSGTLVWGEDLMEFDLH